MFILINIFKLINLNNRLSVKFCIYLAFTIAMVTENGHQNRCAMLQFLPLKCSKWKKLSRPNIEIKLECYSHIISIKCIIVFSDIMIIFSTFKTFPPKNREVFADI